MVCESHASHGKTSKETLVTPSTKPQPTQGFPASLQATSNPTPYPSSCQVAELKQQNSTPMLLGGTVFTFGLGKRGLVLIACFL